MPRGDGRQTPLSLEMARKRRRLALKSRRSAGPAHIRWRVVVRLRGSYAAMTVGRAGETVPLQARPRVPAARSQPAPRGGAGGRLGRLTTPPLNPGCSRRPTIRRSSPRSPLMVTRWRGEGAEPASARDRETLRLVVCYFLGRRRSLGEGRARPPCWATGGPAAVAGL
jgi:hypothetical protein